MYMHLLNQFLGKRYVFKTCNHPQKVCLGFGCMSLKCILHSNICIFPSKTLVWRFKAKFHECAHQEPVFYWNRQISPNQINEIFTIRSFFAFEGVFKHLMLHFHAKNVFFYLILGHVLAKNIEIWAFKMHVFAQ